MAENHHALVAFGRTEPNPGGLAARPHRKERLLSGRVRFHFRI